MKNPSINQSGNVPHAVVDLMVKNDWTIVRAWREHLGQSQQTVADRLATSLAAYQQMEASDELPRHVGEKIAAALGIEYSLLAL